MARDGRTSGGEAMSSLDDDTMDLVAEKAVLSGWGSTVDGRFRSHITLLRQVHPRYRETEWLLRALRRHALENELIVEVFPEREQPGVDAHVCLRKGAINAGIARMIFSCGHVSLQR